MCENRNKWFTSRLIWGKLVDENCEDENMWDKAVKFELRYLSSDIG